MNNSYKVLNSPDTARTLIQNRDKAFFKLKIHLLLLLQYDRILEPQEIKVLSTASCNITIAA